MIAVISAKFALARTCFFMVLVRRDLRLHQLPAEGLQALERTRPILAHETRVADHIGGKNGDKSPFQALSPSSRRLSTKNRRIHAVRMASA
jgi:hypothetical protein